MSNPVLNEDGTLKNIILKVGVKSYRCNCGGNVFHHPDDKNMKIYECNSCKSRFECE